jgi:hypothetical protein
MHMNFNETVSRLTRVPARFCYLFVFPLSNRQSPANRAIRPEDKFHSWFWLPSMLVFAYNLSDPDGADGIGRILVTS